MTDKTPLSSLLNLDTTKFDISGIDHSQIAGMREVSTVEDLGEKIDEATENEYFVTFGNAWRAIRHAIGYGNRNFIRGESARLCALVFFKVREGSDALLVNGDGEFGCDEATANRHYGWLQEQGYEALPRKKGGRARNSDGPTL